MNHTKYHPCPICSNLVRHWDRYPRAVCHTCCGKACDDQGRKLGFSNIDISGGFRSVVVETGEEYSSHICFINKVQCWADEARFGGIVIQTIEGQTSFNLD